MGIRVDCEELRLITSVVICMTSAAPHAVQTRRHSQNRKYTHRRNEPRRQTTCVERLVKFGHEVFEIRERTDRHTDKHADLDTSQFRTPTGGGGANNMLVMTCLILYTV